MKIRQNFLCLVLVGFFVVSFSPSFVSAEPTIAEIMAEITETLQDRLNLTEAQRVFIETELEDQKTGRNTLAMQEAAKKTKIEEEMAEPVIDNIAIDTLVSELNQIREDVITLRVNSNNNIKNILTVAQKNKFESIKVKQLAKLTDDDDDDDDDDTVTIQFYSIVCAHEHDLPNWTNASDRGINKAMLDAYIVAEDPCCSYSSGWSFQVGDQNATLESVDFIGEASGYIETVGPTDGENGFKQIDMSMEGITTFRIRTVWESGYLPFTDDIADSNSSEFYCVDNSLGFNNKEVIENPQPDGEYTCVLLTMVD